jgi:glycosyltransferase involved in cell wall biosynthesis
MSFPLPSITLSYMGVHQIFQLALAASEMNELNALHCSLIDRPGKWGRQLSNWTHPPSLRPLGYEDLPTDRIIEHPAPLIAHRLVQKLISRRKSEHYYSGNWFDHIVARRLQKHPTRLFVGSEICSLHSFRIAQKLRIRRILDCPGIPSGFLDREASIAARQLGVPSPQPSNSPKLGFRKAEELALADIVLACSEFQAIKIAEQGVDPARIRTIPLWADALFWSVERPQDRPPTNRPLRVIYAGSISLKKGVPYLLQSLRQLSNQVECLLVGRVSPEMVPLIQDLPPGCKIEPYVPKVRLRQLYAEHDVLVMPSLGDSFGFVGMEAMAAGLPVIASSNTGVPLPSLDWRIPPRDANALTQRLLHYALNRSALAHDAATASRFARQFTPERYREQVKCIYHEILSLPPIRKEP